MGCKGCPESSPTDKMYNRHGNPIIGANEREQHEMKVQTETHDKRSPMNEAREMSYKDYIERREIWRHEQRRVGQETIETFSEDYKRIQIHELISVYNLEEVHFKFTPDQALGALYEFVHNDVYNKVINEFEGLREQVDKKFALLQSNRLNIKWKP